MRRMKTVMISNKSLLTSYTINYVCFRISILTYVATLKYEDYDLELVRRYTRRPKESLGLLPTITWGCADLRIQPFYVIVKLLRLRN